jgi:hypothetical protein
MSLSDLASIGSLASGVAVLVSLVYLSLQVRQSDKNQRALINQGTVTRNTDILMFLSQPHINALTSRVASGETHFSAEELSYLHLRVRTTVLSCQDTYVQHKAALVDKITLDNSVAVLRGTLSLPVYRALWKLSRRGYAPEWASFVDAQIKSTPIARQHDTVVQFKETLAEVMSEQV